LYSWSLLILKILYKISYTLIISSQITAVAPIYYADLAAAQMAQFIKFDESETLSSHNESTSADISQVLELPRLHERVANTMFFC
jgi:eukaryotic translation initiation factor 2C